MPDSEDEWAMGLALEEARAAAALGDVPVGAVVVRGGEVVARAGNAKEARSDPTAHAEVLALRAAGTALGTWRLTGATVYATLEPCPMCAGALVAARISRLVFAAVDPKAGACGSLYHLGADPRLNHEFEVVPGVREAEAAELLRSWFAGRRGAGSQVPPPRAGDALVVDEHTQMAAFVEEYRTALDATLDGLTEDEARRRLVPSDTTILGLVKHVTWMQRIWFEECVGGGRRRDLGLVQSPGASFRLADDDTIATVRDAHRRACDTARTLVAGRQLDEVVTGRSGPRTLRWVYLQVLRELAHHCGHADILRELVVTGRS